ncbi:MAG: Methyltransferase [Candidatus Beckwithbacteria bacterium GW2011_GWC2_47_9]|uniref:Methyltransferase n=1 Tax=Candidatus Beckwithbacteria bacterium GW2011_GWC2_47_9 TaxID=1618373 RepID=A0A0G1WA38_9BACT|nr:MAG: Methyltransferase [Candidatus Beckwithbacteria bacterium GW2011_GWC2_47_9]
MDKASNRASQANEFSEISFEPLSRCELCQSSSFRSIGSYDLKGIVLRYTLCEQCGFVQMNPVTSEASMNLFYQKEYWRNISKGSLGRVQRKQIYRARQIINFTTERLKKMDSDVVRVLEIGSSFGNTLEMVGGVISSLGKKTVLYGIEPNEAIAKDGVSVYKQIKLIGRSYRDLDKIHEIYDFIILSHVLEHLRDPVGVLRLIREKLASAGFMYIEVPNFYGHQSYHIYHVSCFTPISLKSALANADLSGEVFAYGGNRQFPKFIGVIAYKQQGKGSVGQYSVAVAKGSGDPRQVIERRAAFERYLASKRKTNFLSRIFRKFGGKFLPKF